MTILAFDKQFADSKLCSPASRFTLELQRIEYRRDPLTGMRSRINQKRAERTRQASTRSDSTIRAIESSRKGCAFCPENLESMTPRFPSQFIPEGRIRRNSAVLFPNLYPFGEHHAIAVFSKEHNPSLNDLSVETVRDCLSACVDYLQRIRAKSRDIRYGSINWNYMPPAGASIVHPHLQILADRGPTHLQETVIERSEAYFQKHGTSYWHDLVETEEKLADRLIHRGDSMTWLASYAPQANNEILAVFHKFSSVTQIDEPTLAELASGISAVLKGYSDAGVESLNMSLVSGPLDTTLEYYTLNLRMNSRPGLKQFYTNDCGFMERIMTESVIESRPEEVAKRMRSCFRL
jgi:UDPglucose--hexose-1-phosphate uridylyltransferase